MPNQGQSKLTFILVPSVSAFLVFMGYLVIFSLSSPENQIISLHQLILSSTYMLCGVMSILLAIKHENIVIRILFGLYTLYLLPPATHLLFSSALFFSLKTAIWFYVFYSNIFMYFSLGLVIYYTILFLRGDIDDNQGEIGVKLMPPLSVTLTLILTMYAQFIFDPDYLALKGEASGISDYYLPLYRTNLFYLLFLALMLIYGFALFRKRYKSFFKKSKKIKKTEEEPFVKYILLLNLLFLAIILVLEIINAASGWFQLDLSRYFTVFIILNYMLLLSFYLFIQLALSTRPLRLNNVIKKEDEYINDLTVISKDDPLNISFLKICSNTTYRIFFYIILLVTIIFVPFLIPQESRMMVRIVLSVFAVVGLMMLIYLNPFLIKYIQTYSKSK